MSSRDDGSMLVGDDCAAFALALVPDARMLLATTPGVTVDATVVEITADAQVRVAAALPLAPGGLVSARYHDGAGAWLATLMVVDVDDGSAVLEIGDALLVPSERWAERVGLSGTVRISGADGHEPVVGELLDVSLTGVGARVPRGSVPIGERVAIEVVAIGHPALDAPAIVTRRSASGTIGLELIGPDLTGQRTLAALIRAGRTRP